MKPVLIFVSIISWILIFCGCKESDDPPKIITAGNLVVETTVTTNGSGLVTFKALADNAVKFTFYFGEGLDDDFDIEEEEQIKSNELSLIEHYHQRSITKCSMNNPSGN